ncbi:hypothetical protein BDFG_04834 [Blastomyces dermatitidis ATCC 26199]|nr:hypothetical protein BDFG_04834 [Blastomyces dermatitidis ATCC 26199]
MSLFYSLMAPICRMPIRSSHALTNPSRSPPVPPKRPNYYLFFPPAPQTCMDTYVPFESVCRHDWSPGRIGRGSKRLLALGCFLVPHGGEIGWKILYLYYRVG